MSLQLYFIYLSRIEQTQLAPMFLLKLHKLEYNKKLYKAAWWQAPRSGPPQIQPPGPSLPPQVCAECLSPTGCSCPPAARG